MKKKTLLTCSKGLFQGWFPYKPFSLSTSKHMWLTVLVFHSSFTSYCSRIWNALWAAEHMYSIFHPSYSRDWVQHDRISTVLHFALSYLCFHIYVSNLLPHHHARELLEFLWVIFENQSIRMLLKCVANISEHKTNKY